MMWPTTPSFKQNVGPTSPPETPRNTSPSPACGQRQGTQKTTPGLNPAISHPMSQTPHIKPTGNAHKFSYTHPNQLSPRSSSSSSAPPSDSDSESGSSIGPGPFSPDCPLPGPSVEPTREQEQLQPHHNSITNPNPSHSHSHSHNHNHNHNRTITHHHSHATQIHEIHIHHHDEVKQPVRIVAYTSTEVNFTVEELQSDYDPDDSDTEDLSVMRPHAIEYPQSERSRSRSGGRVDSKIVNSFTRLAMDDDSDDDQDDYMDTDTHRRIIQQIREQKRRRRMTSGSIGKRTISESIGSDTDNEDVVCFLGADEVGSSARRLRRKYERHSFIFQDPPPPRIDEMDEPPTTDDDDIPEVEIFGKELPYWTMEIDSS